MEVFKYHVEGYPIGYTTQKIPGSISTLTINFLIKNYSKSVFWGFPDTQRQQYKLHSMHTKHTSENGQ
jgi:hypothetical protein